MKRSKSGWTAAGGRGALAAWKPRSIIQRAPRPMNGRASASGRGGCPSSASSQFSVPIRSWAVSTRVPSRSKAMAAPESPAISGPLGAIYDRGRLVEFGGIGVERLGRDPDVLLRIGEAALLDGLAHAGQGLGAIAGEAAGGVDHIHVPGPPGQAFGAQHGLVERAHDIVQLDLLGLGEPGAL